jgi:hypothetical protein
MSATALTACATLIFSSPERKPPSRLSTKTQPMWLAGLVRNSAKGAFPRECEPASAEA